MFLIIYFRSWLLLYFKDLITRVFNVCILPNLIIRNAILRQAAILIIGLLRRVVVDYWLRHGQSLPGCLCPLISYLWRTFLIYLVDLVKCCITLMNLFGSQWFFYFHLCGSILMCDKCVWSSDDIFILMSQVPYTVFKKCSHLHWLWLNTILAVSLTEFNLPII